MKNVDNRSKKISLITLLLLLIIFSMYLTINIQIITNLNTSVMSQERPQYSNLLVALAMGIALLYSAIKASNNSLKLIYIVAIIPFILSPDVLKVIDNRILIHIFNVAMDFLLILIIIGYIIRKSA